MYIRLEDIKNNGVSDWLRKRARNWLGAHLHRKREASVYRRIFSIHKKRVQEILWLRALPDEKKDRPVAKIKNQLISFFFQKFCYLSKVDLAESEIGAF